jgi:hypothetical protein
MQHAGINFISEIMVFVMGELHACTYCYGVRATRAYNSLQKLIESNDKCSWKNISTGAPQSSLIAF